VPVNTITDDGGLIRIMFGGAMFRAAFALTIIGLLVAPRFCLALPQTTEVDVADVTPNSFSLVWMSDRESEPSVRVYSDESLTQEITSGLTVLPMGGIPSDVAGAAKSRGILKVTVTGVSASTTYYARAVTTDSQDPDGVSFSPSVSVTTQAETSNFTEVDSEPVVFANDLCTFPVYVMPGDGSLGFGDLVMLTAEGSQTPVTAFVGAGAASPEGLIDLNNLFGPDGISLNLGDMERAKLVVYRGYVMPSLEHFRWIDEQSGYTEVKGAVRGFFVDFNLDGTVDDADFGEFAKRYRTRETDPDYNPDFDYVPDTEGVVDAREFSGFAENYGRTDVP